MRTHREDEFIGWAERSGFQIDPRYPHSAVLRFHPDPQRDRFWEVPSEPERRHHHGVIHVSFRTDEGVDLFVDEMDRRGFPLPSEVPDSTFKQPDWMKQR